jgi:hypothetical protein
MTDTIEQSFWYKIRYTPIRDAVRGRMTARLDLRRRLDAATLPPPVKQLLLRVVTATRLWRLERIEVLQELIAHFTDGLASGISADELIKTFGNEAQAAQLIRRAKRRGRPLPWHAMRIAGWSMIPLLVLYCGYAAYFFAGRPSPRVDYVANINKTIESTPMEERAWPLYRRALIGINKFRLQSLSALPQTPQQRAEVSKFIREHEAEIEWIRRGSTKATLGFLIGAKGSVNDAELWPNQHRSAVDSTTGEPLIGAVLPPISLIHGLAAMLRADGMLASQAGDGKRLLEDVRSTFNLSQQVGENAALVWSLVSISISHMALDPIEQTLHENPALIPREELLALARQLSVPKVAADLITFGPERMFFDDTLQRSFTDDGFGNGRLTAQGVDYLRGLSESNLRPDSEPDVWLKRALQPAASLGVASRQEIKEEYTRVADRAEANLKLPLRDSDWRSVQEFRSSSPAEIQLLYPTGYWRAQAIAEQYLGRRDGVVAGIALELFRREHGRYPDSLNPLAPQLLPELPTDRIAGGALRYRLVNGQPLIYSVGANRKDDGGRYTFYPHAAANWESNPEPMPDGDWVLYPTLKRP